MSFVTHSMLKPDKVEKRVYQENIAKKALTANTLVVLPTGLGKTAIAALVSAELLAKNKEGKILIVAPTKPLAAQHQSVFRDLLALPDDDFVLLTGAMASAKRVAAFNNARVISATPQTIEHDVTNGKIDLSSVVLLVVDETHRAVHNYSYVRVTQKYFQQSKRPLVLGLTASPSAEKIHEICENLEIKNVELKSETDEDVAPYVQKRDVQRVYVDLPPELDQVRALLKEFAKNELDRLKEMNLVHAPTLRKRDLIDLQKYVIQHKLFGAMVHATALLKVSHAIEMIETQGVSQLATYFEKVKTEKTRTASHVLRSPRVQRAMLLTKELKEKGIEHPKLDKLGEVLRAELAAKPGLKGLVFAHFRDTSQLIVDSLNKTKGINAVRFVGQASRGKTDLGLNQKEQQEILDRFRAGEFNFLVCTSVGEEGLDIPQVDLVVFYEPVPSEIRKIQREGRTGRKRPGKVITLITRHTRDESYFYSAARKEKQMKATLRGMQEEAKKPQKTLAWW